MDPAAVRLATDLIQRVRSEFLEMPGLRLTEQQARRLLDLDPPSCAAVLGGLIDTGFLCRTRDGFFMRADQGQPARTDWPFPRRKIPAA
jgi:hypothetical protein